MIQDYLQAHQQFIIGAAAGYAVGHIPQVVLMVFHLAMKIPWLRAAVVANPKQAKAIIDAIHDELDRDIDAEAAPPAPKP